MSSATASHRGLESGDAEALRRLRGALEEAEFHEQGVCAALEIDETRAVSGKERPLLLHRTRHERKVDALVRLFLMGMAVPASTAGRALGATTFDACVRMGLLHAAGDECRAAVQLLPYRGLWLAFDWPSGPDGQRAADYVMGVGSSSLTLANLTLRRPSRLTLDVGSGCGIQSLLAAPHSERVVAVDRNARAVEFTRFNAALNQLPHIESVQGDLLTPVRETGFELAVSNPPFVISPESHYIYRDSGMRGDEIVQAIVRQIPAALAEGGFCQILCNWAHVGGQDWRERLQGWCVNSGCDAWIMVSETLPVDAYAAKWIKHTETHLTDERFQELFAQWLEYYRRQSLEAVSGGLITLRKRGGGRNWFHADPSPARMLGPAGEAVAGRFAAYDLLEAGRESPQRLLSQRLLLSPAARLEQVLAPDVEGWRVDAIELRLDAGLGYRGGADAFVAELLVHCNGQRTVEELLAILAAAMEREPGEVAPAGLQIVERLLAQGFLLPAAAASP